MKPIIAITPNITDEGLNTINQDYCFGIENAGGIPIILSANDSEDYIEKICLIADGFLFSGGVDVDPILFNESPQRALGKICPQRDKFELQLCKRVLEKNIPLLAICRGAQLLNVAMGGTLFQDIKSETQLKHSQEAPRSHGSHYVDILPTSKLFSIFNSQKLLVNSFHHQSLKRVANDLIVSAKCEDGIIEAVEHRSRQFVVGVQWHPESMKDNYQQQKLFGEFILQSNSKNI